MNRVRQFLAPPVFEDEEKTRIANLLNIILLALVLLGLGFGVYSILTMMGSPDLSYMLAEFGVAVLAMLVPWFLMRQGHVRGASLLFTSLIWAASVYWAYESGGVRGYEYPSLVLVPVIAGLLLGGRAAIVVGGLSMLAGLGLMYAEATGFLVLRLDPADYTTLDIWVTRSMDLAIVVVLLYLASRSVSDSLERAWRSERVLIETNRDLEANQAILQTRARELQESASELTLRSQELEAANLELEEARRRQEAINVELQEANERTRRRAAQLQAVAEVGRAITQMRDMERLLPQVTELISQHFGFYHVGIFMVDEAGRYAVLRTASSEGGQRMLARGHRLPVGSQGIVGYVTGTGEPRVALDVGADAVHFVNLDLPDTRSEMALPLRVGGQTVGALDVQSVKAEAFDDESVAVLSALADQVAIAIENTRLFQQSQEALAEVEETQRRYLQGAWQGFLQQQPDLRFEYTREGVSSALDVELPAAKQAMMQGELVALSEVAASGDNDAVVRAALSVPIKLRGQVIGVLDLHEADEARLWTEHEIALAEAVAEQLALTLESARLFEQTQARARREALTRQITDRIRDAVDVDAMLKTAIQELGQALGAPRVYVRLATDAGGDGE